VESDNDKINRKSEIEKRSDAVNDVCSNGHDLKKYGVIICGKCRKVNAANANQREKQWVEDSRAKERDTALAKKISKP